jgi:hypothetical protein
VNLLAYAASRYSKLKCALILQLDFREWRSSGLVVRFLSQRLMTAFPTGKLKGLRWRCRGGQLEFRQQVTNFRDAEPNQPPGTFFKTVVRDD